MGEFGDKFRKAREKKEISLDAVSNVTKISARMLQAIEEEQFDQLPGGVFNRGFIRAYAKHLGMDAEEAVTDYLACLRQAQIDAHEVWEPEGPALVRTPGTRTAPPEKRFNEPSKTAGKPEPASKAQPALQVEELPDLQLPRAERVRSSRSDLAGSSSPEIPWRILAIAAVAVVLAAILWIRRSHPHTAAASTPPTKVETAAVVPAPPATTPGKVAAASAPPSSTATAATPSASTPKTPAAHPSAPANANSSKPGGEENDVTVRTLQKPPSSTASQAQVPLRLVIRATETSWISIIADGQTVNRETLIAPAHASVRASHEIVARIGNAAGVTFLWNGQEIRADGAEGEVKTFVFDANGMRVTPNLPEPSQ